MIKTKDELYNHIIKMKDNRSEFHSSDLDKSLVKWLDKEKADDLITIDEDHSGQGGSIIWLKNITLKGKKFLLEYVTFGSNISNDKYGIWIDVSPNNK